MLSMPAAKVTAQIKPSIHFTEEDGLPHKTVQDVLIDNDGFIWIATENGISKYDGRISLQYTINRENKSLLHGHSLWIITAIIYAGFYNSGLAIIRKDTIRSVIDGIHDSQK